MGLTDLTFKIILIFIPGLISFVIVDNLTVHRETKTHHWLIYSFLLGFLAYLCWYGIVKIIGCSLGIVIPFDFFDNLTNQQVRPNMGQIAVGTIISVPLGFFVARMINKKWLYNLAKRFDVSDKFGDLDLFEYILNSDDVPKWVVIRDKDSDRAYEGFIWAWSDSTEREGVFLRDVKIYENTSGEWLYDMPALYLSKKLDSLRFEFPCVEYTQHMKFGNTKVGEESNGET